MPFCRDVRSVPEPSPKSSRTLLTGQELVEGRVSNSYPSGPQEYGAEHGFTVNAALGSAGSETVIVLSETAGKVSPSGLVTVSVVENVPARA